MCKHCCKTALASYRRPDAEVISHYYSTCVYYGMRAIKTYGRYMYMEKPAK